MSFLWIGLNPSEISCISITMTIQMYQGPSKLFKIYPVLCRHTSTKILEFVLTRAAYCKRWVTNVMEASHKSNPSSVPWGIVDSYSTLPWVTWEAVQLWRVYPDGGWYNTRWLTGLWSTQAMVEGIVLKVAWCWGRDNSVVNDPLGEPGRTPLYVGLPSA